MVGLCRRLAMMILRKAIPVDMELGGCCPLNGGFSEEEPSMPRGGTTMDENE
jgi:hypothetical protein